MTARVVADGVFRRRISVVLVGGLTAFLVGGLAPSAAAHPTLVATIPEANYSVADAPEEIGLVFDERVTLHELTVRGQARGTISTSEPHVSADGSRVVIRPDDPLPDGAYTVTWHVTGVDGHDVDGTFGFGVGTSAAPSASSVVDESGIGLTALLQWALLGAIAVGLGGLAGDALTRRRVRVTERRVETAERRGEPERELEARTSAELVLIDRATTSTEQGLVAPRPWLLPAGLVGVAASAGLLLTTSENRLLVIQLGAFTAAALAAIRPRRRLFAVAIIAVVVTEGFSGHLQAEAAPLGSLTIVVHLAAVAVWVGALLHVLRAAVRWRRDRSVARALLVEYAFLALALYWVVVTTGTTAAVLVLPTLDSLWLTGYGQLLLAKLTLVATATGLALAARQRLHRRRSTPGTVRLARIEWAALAAAITASAVLSSVAPPTDPTEGLAYPPPARDETVRLGTLAGQITTGVVASTGQLEVRLRLPEWDPSARHDFTVTGAVTRPSDDEAELDLQPCGAGCFVGQSLWEMGTNVVELDVQARDWQGGRATFDVPWPPRDGRDMLDQMLATMAAEPTVTFVESATSDTSRPTPFQSDELAVSGAEFIDLQPYRSGTVNSPTILSADGSTTELSFAISAESIYVRQTLDAGGRLLAETLTSPSHLLERTYSYELDE